VSLKSIFFCVCIAVLLLLHPSFARDDDETVVEYPDRSYGVDLGEDWQVMPDGEFIGDEATRGEYEDTVYGPTTEKGLEIFPDFHWVKEKAKVPKVGAPDEYYIYYETTTAPAKIIEELPPKDEDAEGVYIGEGKSGFVDYKEPEARD
jgi:hypothetical protein